MTAVRPSSSFSIPPLDECGDGDESLSRLVRMANGMQTRDDEEFFRSALCSWINSEGQVPLERCMRLPKTTTKIRLAKRNQYLCRAAEELLLLSPGDGPGCLLKNWETFVVRGQWRNWRDDPEPPKCASPLYEALFYATKLNRGEVVGLRALQIITRSVFQRSFRNP